MKHLSVFVLFAVLSIFAAQSGLAASVKFTQSDGIEFVETRLDDRLLYATVLNTRDVAYKSITFVCDFFDQDTPISKEISVVTQLPARDRAIVNFSKPRKHAFDAVKCRVIRTRE